MFLAAIYSLAYIFELLSESFDIKVFWGKMTYLGGAFLPLVFAVFTVNFSQSRLKLSRKRLLWLSVIPVLTIVFSFTNEYHHLYWTEVTYYKNTTLIEYHHGVAFAVYYVFAQIAILFGLGNLLFALIRFPRAYTTHVIFIIISSLLPVMANLMYVFGYNLAPGYDLTPIAFSIAGIMISAGILHLRMFEIIPIARNTLADILTDGIIVINSKMIIEDFNPAAGTFLIHPEKLRLGAHIEDVITQKPLWMDQIDLKARHRFEEEININNEQRVFELTINPLTAANKIFSGNLILLHDITRRKMIEKNLMATNEKLNREIELKEKLIDELDSFAHTVAHDIKGNLAAIVSGQDLLRDLLQSGEYHAAEEISAMIRESSLNTLHITRELLTLATMGQDKISVGPLDMNEIIRATLRRINTTVNPDSYSLEMPENLPVASGYAPWIEEVWFNYLSNGIKYGGEPAVLKIGGEHTQNGSVRFWIKDNGKGISVEEKELLFKKFSRLNPERVKGTGLGLSIVGRIIDKLGGEVGVESSGIAGEGSLFFFTLPLPGHEIQVNQSS
jgi:signal transduction histidine kinase